MGWDEIQVVGDKIVGLKDGKLMVYGINPPDIREFILPEELGKFRQFHFGLDKGFGLAEGGIETFKLNYK